MAMEMSDVTLMDSNLTKLSYVINMGRRVLRTVKENIFISLVAKLAVVGLAFVGKMTLLFAIASDVGIMLVVTLNGMKLLPSETFDPRNHLVSLKRKKRQKKKEMESLVEMTSPLEGTEDIDGLESAETELQSDLEIV